MDGILAAQGGVLTEGVAPVLPGRSRNLGPTPAPASLSDPMRHSVGVMYVGVDLAWGERRPTGVAVLDSGGALLALASATTDDEIAAQVAPYVEGDCLVAIDAPLIVTNPSGNRPCEAALNQDFGRFEAGAHPANTAKPEFADGSRGARLAERFGLDMDPAARSGRRAIEVYPHPATVALFSLRRTLKYKARPGRTLAELREALLTLTGHLEGLRAGDPAMDVARLAAWRDLVAEIETARTKAALRRAEDQVDAVVCAYVALFSDRRPEATTTYGDAVTGYIVTPTLPAELEPERRRRRSSVDTAVSQYAASLPQVQHATEHYARVVTELLDEAGINYLGVTARAKSVKSFAAKAARADGGRLLHPDPLTDIADQVGVRVVTYLQRDVDAVARLLAAELDVLDDRDMGVETAGQGRFGYASRHLLIRLRDDDGRPGAPPRCRCARCCSTRGRSSSTRPATRVRCPRSTPPTSTAGSRWPRGCWSWRSGSSPRSTSGCRPRRARRARPAVVGRVAARRPGALPDRALHRGGLVATRPLRVGLGAAG